MNNLKLLPPCCIPLIIALALVTKCTSQEMVCHCDLCSTNPRLDPKKLLQEFPDALKFDNRIAYYDEQEEEVGPFNQIMCPMMRLLCRTGMLPQSWLHPLYSIPSVVAAMNHHLGFGPIQTATMVKLAKGISAGQLATLSTIPGFVNLHQLHRVVGISHGSGYAFDWNSTRVSLAALNRTMTAFRELGLYLLTFEDLQLVKMEIAQ